MNNVCRTGSSVPRVMPSLLHDFYDIDKAVIKGPDTPSCKIMISAASISLAEFLAKISTVYAIAGDVFKNSRICGANWMVSSHITHDFSVPFISKLWKTNKGLDEKAEMIC